MIHGYYLYSDNYEKFDQATYTFAGLGIVTTLAEFTGVGISVDAAIAGGKTAAKIFKGSAMMGNLVSYLDRKVVNGAQGARVDALKIVLPMLELTAVIAFEGEEIKKFIVGAINSVDDFDIWVRYLYRMVEEGGLVARRDGLEQALEDIAFIWISSAYASPFKKIDDLLVILKEVNDKAKYGSSEKTAGPIFTRVIAELNEAALSGNSLAKMSNKSDELVALMAFASRGGPDLKKGLTALRNSPCQDASCFNGKSYEEFIKDFGKIDEYLVSSGSGGKRIDEVLEQLSGTVTRKDGMEADVFVVARGGAGTLLVLKQLIDRGSKIVVTSFEEPKKVFGGTRIYDLVGTVKGVPHYIESKNWSPGTAVDRIKNSLNVYTKNDGADGAPGQLMKDIITTMKGDPPIGGVIRWEFPALSPAKRDEMIEAVMKKIKGEDEESKRLQRYLLRAVKPNDLNPKFNSTVEGEFKSALTLLLKGVQ
ncbi:MAG: hypothetical protein E6Q71_00650 [Pseudomonas sp.]|nr:MAG: hypothetical protein E6Q71_00650 [Pseudomonas sp.]